LVAAGLEGPSEGNNFSFFLAVRLPYQNANKIMAMIMIAPSATPTPIAALSPVESPLWEVPDVLDAPGLDALGLGVALDGVILGD
jgi:hypothetical protein